MQALLRRDASPIRYHDRGDGRALPSIRETARLAGWLPPGASSSPARRSGARRPARVSRSTSSRPGRAARLSVARIGAGSFATVMLAIDGGNPPGRPSRGDRRQRLQCALVGGDVIASARRTGPSVAAGARHEQRVALAASRRRCARRSGRARGRRHCSERRRRSAAASRRGRRLSRAARHARDPAQRRGRLAGRGQPEHERHRRYRADAGQPDLGAEGRRALAHDAIARLSSRCATISAPMWRPAPGFCVRASTRRMAISGKVSASITRTTPSTSGPIFVRSLKQVLRLRTSRGRVQPSRRIRGRRRPSRPARAQGRGSDEAQPHPRASWPSNDDTTGFNLIVILVGAAASAPICSGRIIT